MSRFTIRSSSCRAISTDIPDSLATPPYHPLLPADPQGYIPYRHRTAVYKFELDVQLLAASAPGPVLDFGPERGPGKGTMAGLGPLIRHLVSTRLPSGGRAAFLSPLSPLYGTRPCV